MIGAPSVSTGGSESVAGDKSSGSATRLLKGVKSVSGSIACALHGGVYPSALGWRNLLRIKGWSSHRCDLPNTVRRQS